VRRGGAVAELRCGAAAAICSRGERVARARLWFTERPATQFIGYAHSMPTGFPMEVRVHVPELFDGQPQQLTLEGGLLTLVGPNGSGKTQVLHALRRELSGRVHGRKIRYVSPGRLYVMEGYRSDVDGSRGGEVYYGKVGVGQRHYLEQRHSSSSIAGDMLALHQRPDLRIKVEARLQDLFQRRIALEWSPSGLEIQFTRTDDGAVYEGSREASGLLHLVAILAAAFDDGVGALLIDEPEVSLHPQLQAYVHRELRSVAGDPQDSTRKLVVIATHSPAMLEIRRPEHLTRLVFFQDAKTHPKQIKETAAELGSKAISGLLARMGESHRAAFFARRLLLVEGPSDEIITHALAAKLDLPLDAAGTQIVPVIGKGEMGAVRKLFALAGKQCAVLADLDAFVDDGRLVGEFYGVPVIEDSLTEKGHRSLQAFSASARDDLKKALFSHYSDLATVADQHSYWTRRDSNAEPGAARARAGTASLLAMSYEEVKLLPNAEIWMPLRTRILALLDALELGGCFILRRGALECYAGSSAVAGLGAKPEAAAVEAEAILMADDASLRLQWADIIRCVEYSAQHPRVDEAGRLRQLLLSVLAPCLDGCTSDTPSSELNQRARGLLNDRASLFDIENVTVAAGPARLKVMITSSILDGWGFPIEVTKETLYAVVGKALPSKTGRIPGAAAVDA